VTNGRLDFGTWERILGVSWMADTGVLTAGGGSEYWSKSSASRCAQSNLARNGLWLWWAATKRWSVRHMAGAENRTPSSCLSCSLEPGGPIELR